MGLDGWGVGVIVADRCGPLGGGTGCSPFSTICEFGPGDKGCNRPPAIKPGKLHQAAMGDKGEVG